MKTIVVACGSGIATSTIIRNHVDELLKNYSIDYQIRQCSITELSANLDGADLLVTSTPVSVDYGIPQIVCIPFLTGIDAQATEQEIIEALKASG